MPHVTGDATAAGKENPLLSLRHANSLTLEANENRGCLAARSAGVAGSSLVLGSPLLPLRPFSVRTEIQIVTATAHESASAADASSPSKANEFWNGLKRTAASRSPNQPLFFPTAFSADRRFIISRKTHFLRAITAYVFPMSSCPLLRIIQKHISSKGAVAECSAPSSVLKLSSFSRTGPHNEDPAAPTVQDAQLPASLFPCICKNALSPLGLPMKALGIERSFGEWTPILLGSPRQAFTRVSAQAARRRQLQPLLLGRQQS
jgi:hypothetical protein